jgi:hypothetical protein
MMDEWDEIARRLEQNRNEVKWQESVNRTAVALRMAYRAGRGAGDEQAPPTGHFQLAVDPECPPDTIYFAAQGEVVGVITGLKVPDGGLYAPLIPKGVFPPEPYEFTPQPSPRAK